MVLRKPYAFLIRHFKAIHIILVVLMGILGYKMYHMSSFLGPYLKTGNYVAVSGVVGEYVGATGILIPLIIVALLGSIAYLLKRKEKPIKYYLLTILVYAIEFIVMVVGYSLFTSIQQGTVNSTFAGIYNDLVSALAFLPLPFAIIALVRGVGFNVKQFNFKKDLIELHIEEGDDEEFALEMEFDNENLKSKFNRRLRFIKYVYLENKKVFFAVFIGLALVVVGLVIKYVSSIEHIYKEKEKYVSSGIEFVVNDSYITDKDCSGRLVRDGKYYVVLNITGTNNTEYDQYLPFDFIYLKVENNKQYNPIDGFKDEFSDFGKRMTSKTTIKAGSKMTFALVFEIDYKYRNNDMRLDHIKSFEKDINGSYVYAKIKLRPKKIKEDVEVKTVKIGEKLDFEGSLVAGTELTINSAEIANKFEYKYYMTIGGKEKEYIKTIYPTSTSKNKKVILKMDANLTKNEELNDKIYKSFYERFALIEYESNGKMYFGRSYLIDLTEKDGNTYLEIDQEAMESNKVNLVFTIRGKVYKYNIIDKKEEPVENNKDGENKE